MNKYDYRISHCKLLRQIADPMQTVIMLDALVKFILEDKFYYR